MQESVFFYTGDNEKALPLQRMCTYAAGKGHEKSQGLIACQPLAM